MITEPVININDIRAAIISGMKRGYDRGKLYLCIFEEGISAIPEYLLTVSVADALYSNLNGSSLPSLQIGVEYPYIKFANQAFPPFAYGDNIFQVIKREVIKRIKKKEKIDIAILQGNGYERRSLYGVEIKAINQRTDLIKSDLYRMADAISRTDKVGESSLRACFVTFMARFDKDSDYVFAENLEEKLKRKDRNVQTKLIEPLLKLFDSLDFSFERYKVDVATAEEEAQYWMPEITDDFSYSTKAVYVYLITITRKKDNRIEISR